MIETLEAISVEDWIDWKANPITKRYTLMLCEEIDALKDKLSWTAGHNPINDAHTRGIIDGLRLAIDAKPEETPSD